MLVSTYNPYLPSSWLDSENLSETVAQWSNEINECLRDQGVIEFFFENNKLYYTGYPSPRDQQLKNTDTIETFRIDHIDYNTLMLIAIKSYLQYNKQDITFMESSPYISRILVHLWDEKTCCEIMQYLCSLPTIDKKIFCQRFIFELNKVNNLNGKVLNKECLKNVLLFLNVDSIQIEQLIIHYLKTSSLNQIKEFLKNKYKIED